jgi:nucleoid DNA-binding protein
MSQSKGVSMPGFGTFSFVQKKLDVGNNKFVLMQRPVFLIAEKFAQTHALSYTRYPIAGNIPVHTLNYSAIAQETAFSRDDIELCIKYILQIFNRSVAAQKNIDFTFNGIGKLQIRNSKVKMKFFKEFVNSVDSSGKAINDMQNVMLLLLGFGWKKKS